MPSETENSAPWSRLRRDIGVVLWSSFLTASLGTMWFFAYFDPQWLALDRDPPPWLADRMTGYAVGFFFFWLLTAFAGTLVAYLLDTQSDRNSRTDGGAERRS